MSRVWRARARVEAPAADRISLITRHGVVQLAKDARQISVDGRSVSLAAPVRVRQGAWRVPGDLLVRGLPTLLGAGVRVTPTEIREARPAPSAPPRGRSCVLPSRRRPARSPCRRSRRPVRSRPPAPRGRAAPAEPVEPARTEPESPRALAPPAGCSRARGASRSARTLPTRGSWSRPTPRSSRGSSRPMPA